jgi:PAS domain S-box-containing protein
MREEDRRVRERLEDEVVRVAHLVAEQQERVVESAEGVLTGVAQLPEILRQPGGSRCTDVLASVVLELPAFNNVAVTDTGGDVLCAAFQLPGPENIAHRLDYQRAQSTRAFSAGEYAVGQVSSLGSLNFAKPVYGAGGKPNGFMTIALDIDALQQRLEASGLPPNAAAVVTDARGAVLAQVPRAMTAGRPWASPLLDPLREQARGGLGGVRSNRDADGVQRFYAFAAAMAHGEPAMLVAVGVPEAPALASGRPALQRTLVAFGVLALMALLVAFAMGEFLLVRRLDRIVRAARRLSAGNLSARTGLGSDGGEIGQLATAFDEMAHSLESLTRQNRLILDSAGEGIVGLDRGQRITFANPPAARAFGREEAELRGRPLRDFLRVSIPEDSDQDDIVGLAMHRGAAHHVNGVIQRKDGQHLPVECVATPIRDGQEVVGAVVAFRDVSDRLRLEEQLRHAQKMEAVGQLSAGVAHEINNPLAYIAANLAYAIENLSHGPASAASSEVMHALRDAEEGAGRVRAIVRDLKMFSRQDDSGDESVDAREVIRSSINLAQNEIRHRARLVVDLAQVPDVAGSGQRLGQVFLNLLINAAQAIPEGHVEANEIRVACHLMDDGRVAVDVSDTGCGIPAEVLPRIFEPFFTTKPVGVGTGLGLSVCHGIVTGLGGDIEVSSRAGQGTRFRVWLRTAAYLRARTSPRLATPYPRPAVNEGRRGRVLVVDDEQNVLRAIARILDSGHDVVCYDTADGALEHLASDQGFDVILCDLMMPGMTGMELYERLGESAPGLTHRLVFMTAGAFTQDAQAFLDEVPNPRLDKPIEPQVLRNLIQTALRAAA